MEKINNLLTKDECRTVVKNALGHSVVLVDYKIVPFSDDVIGYLGEYFKLICCVKDNKTTESVHDHEYFLKTIPVTDEIDKDLVTSFKIFPKESALYTKLFTEFQPYEIKKWRGKCFYARDDLLVLEDLTVSGYRTLNDTETLSLNLNLVKSALRCLARMHANSIVFEKKTGIDIQKAFGEHLNEISVSKENGWFIAGINTIKEVIKIHPKFQSVEMQKYIDETLHEKISPVFELVNTSKSFANVLCHRDVWGKNILFKVNDNYEDDKKTVPECVVVDFQLCRYSPPAFDVLFLIHLNMTRCERQENELQCLRYYYDHLDKYCSRHDVILNETMSWNNFLESCEEFRLLPIVLNGIYIPFIKLPENYLNDVHKVDPEQYNKYVFNERSELIIDFLRKDPIYKTAVFEVVEDIVSYLYE